MNCKIYIFSLLLFLQNTLVFGDPAKTTGSGAAVRTVAPSSDDYVIKKSAPIVVTDDDSFAKAAQESVKNAADDYTKIKTTVIAIKGDVTIYNSHTLAGNIEIVPDSDDPGNSLWFSAQQAFSGLPHGMAKVVIGKPSGGKFNFSCTNRIKTPKDHFIQITIQNCSFEGSINADGPLNLHVKDSKVTLGMMQFQATGLGNLFFQNNIITCTPDTSKGLILLQPSEEQLKKGILRSIQKEDLYSSSTCSVCLEGNTFTYISSSQLNISLVQLKGLPGLDATIGAINALDAPAVSFFTGDPLYTLSDNNHFPEYIAAPSNAWNSYFKTKIPGFAFCFSFINNTVQSTDADPSSVALLDIPTHTGVLPNTFFYAKNNQALISSGDSVPWSQGGTTEPSLLQFAQWEYDVSTDSAGAHDFHGPAWLAGFKTKQVNQNDTQNTYFLSSGHKAPTDPDEKVVDITSYLSSSDKKISNKVLFLAPGIYEFSQLPADNKLTTVELYGMPFGGETPVTIRGKDADAKLHFSHSLVADNLRLIFPKITTGAALSAWNVMLSSSLLFTGANGLSLNVQTAPEAPADAVLPLAPLALVKSSGIFLLQGGSSPVYIESRLNDLSAIHLDSALLSPVEQVSNSYGFHITPLTLLNLRQTYVDSAIAFKQNVTTPVFLDDGTYSLQSDLHATKTMIHCSETFLEQIAPGDGTYGSIQTNLGDSVFIPFPYLHETKSLSIEIGDGTNPYQGLLHIVQDPSIVPNPRLTFVEPTNAILNLLPYVHFQTTTSATPWVSTLSTKALQSSKTCPFLVYYPRSWAPLFKDTELTENSHLLGLQYTTGQPAIGSLWKEITELPLSVQTIKASKYAAAPNFHYTGPIMAERFLLVLLLGFHPEDAASTSEAAWPHIENSGTDIYKNPISSVVVPPSKTVFGGWVGDSSGGNTTPAPTTYQVRTGKVPAKTDSEHDDPTVTPPPPSGDGGSSGGGGTGGDTGTGGGGTGGDTGTGGGGSGGDGGSSGGDGGSSGGGGTGGDTGTGGGSTGGDTGTGGGGSGGDSGSPGGDGGSSGGDGGSSGGDGGSPGGDGGSSGGGGTGGDTGTGGGGSGGDGGSSGGGGTGGDGGSSGGGGTGGDGGSSGGGGTGGDGGSSGGGGTGGDGGSSGGGDSGSPGGDSGSSGSGSTTTPQDPFTFVVPGTTGNTQSGGGDSLFAQGFVNSGTAPAQHPGGVSSTTGTQPPEKETSLFSSNFSFIPNINSSGDGGSGSSGGSDGTAISGTPARPASPNIYSQLSSSNSGNSGTGGSGGSGNSGTGGGSSSGGTGTGTGGSGSGSTGGTGSGGTGSGGPDSSPGYTAPPPSSPNIYSKYYPSSNNTSGGSGGAGTGGSGSGSTGGTGSGGTGSGGTGSGGTSGGSGGTGSGGTSGGSGGSATSPTPAVASPNIYSHKHPEAGAGGLSPPSSPPSSGSGSVVPLTRTIRWTHPNPENILMFIIYSGNQKLGVVSTQSNQNTYTFKISSSIPNRSLRLFAVDKGPLNSTQ